MVKIPKVVAQSQCKRRATEPNRSAHGGFALSSAIVHRVLTLRAVDVERRSQAARTNLRHDSTSLRRISHRSGMPRPYPCVTHPGHACLRPYSGGRTNPPGSHIGCDIPGSRPTLPRSHAMSEPVLIPLDVRDVDEWIGGSSSPCGKDYAPRKGRIPGAKWRRGTRCVSRSGTMRRLGLTTVQPSMGQTGWSAAAPES